MTEPKPPTMRDYADAWARAAEQLRPVWQRITDAARPLVEFANSPHGRALIAAHEAAHQRGELKNPCHCLCAASHPAQDSICLGEMPERDLEHLTFNSPVAGRTEVPMCPPCAAATTSDHEDADVNPA